MSEEVETLPKGKIAISDAARVASPVTFYTPGMDFFAIKVCFQVKLYQFQLVVFEVFVTKNKR